MPARRRVAVRAKPKRRAVRKAAYYPPPASTAMVMPAARAKRSKAASGFRSAGSALGSALGGALGGPGGALLGGALGKVGGGLISSIFGHGDYAVSNVDQIKDNNLVLGNAANIPKFGSGRVAVNFKHREFLGDVYSSSVAGAFKIDSYSINPGLAATFPWLSNCVGATFQQYRINGMTFEFRSMSSDALNSTNTALGSVVMATDYDSSDTVFASKQEMENTEYGVSCKPSVCMMHAIECARNQTSVSELYIRAYDQPSNSDIRLYDLGRFSIATTGCQGTNVNLGELWVTYDIDCFKAIQQVPGYILPLSEWTLTPTGASWNTDPLGAAGSQQVYPGGADQMGLTFTANKIQWPSSILVGSCYVMDLLLSGASTAITPGVITAGNGMTVLSAYNEGNVTTANYHLFILAVYNGGGSPNALPYVNIANGTYPATATSGQLIVYQVNGNAIH